MSAKTASKRKPAPVLLLAALLALAVGGVVLSWSWSHASGSAAPSGTAGPAAQPLASEVEQLTKSVRDRMALDAEQLDVGWRPAAAPEPMPVAPVAGRAELGRAGFKLKGIARDGSQPVAFIDNRTMGLGEEVEGYKLIEIGNESVTFLDPRGKRYVVGLYGGD